MGHSLVQCGQLLAPLLMAAAGEGGSVSVNAALRLGFLVCHHPVWTVKLQLKWLEVVIVEQGTQHTEVEDVPAFIIPC